MLLNRFEENNTLLLRVFSSIQLIPYKKPAYHYNAVGVTSMARFYGKISKDHYINVMCTYIPVILNTSMLRALKDVRCNVIQTEDVRSN